MKDTSHAMKVFEDDSEYLSSTDLEVMETDGKPLIFRIKAVEARKGLVVGGKKMNKNLVTFHDEKIKPLVCNPTNTKSLIKIKGQSRLCDLVDFDVELFVDHNVKMRGKVVDGIRVKLPTADYKTKEETEMAIEMATEKDEIRALRTWITKYKLSKEATVKFNELKNV